MSEFNVLKALSESGGEMEWSALMNTDKSVQETSGSLQLLLHSGYIFGSLAPYSSVKITPIGRAYYSKLSAEHEEKRREQKYIREENAKMEHHAIVNKWVSFASMLFAGGSLLLGILAAFILI